MTSREAPTTAYMRAGWAALVEERDRLKTVLGRIPKAVIIKVIGSKDWQDGAGFYTVRWGCGICQGELKRRYNDRTKRFEYAADDYAHGDWCPRGKP